MKRLSAMEPVFENRFDAGRQLAEKMGEFAVSKAVVLAIPNGGVAVGLGVALAVGTDFDLVIARKIPLPMSPEGGFGAVAEDGSIVVDEAMIKYTGLTRQQVEDQVNLAKASVRQRSAIYRHDRKPLPLAGRNVIIVDDGLASGYTMKVAIASVRKQKPSRVIAAVPVGPVKAVEEIKRLADRLVVCVTGSAKEFYVSDYYRAWYDVTDNEALTCLKEFAIRKAGGKIRIPPRKPRP